MTSKQAMAWTVVERRMNPPKAVCAVTHTAVHRPGLTLFRPPTSVEIESRDRLDSVQEARAEAIDEVVRAYRQQGCADVEDQYLEVPRDLRQAFNTLLQWGNVHKTATLINDTLGTHFSYRHVHAFLRACVLLEVQVHGISTPCHVKPPAAVDLFHALEWLLPTKTNPHRVKMHLLKGQWLLRFEERNALLQPSV